MSSFWTVIAQIVPVLAIPLVLEARIVARRVSQSQTEFERRSRRAGWGLLLSVLGLSMVTLEMTALTAIPSGRTIPGAEWFAFSVVMLALVTVFMIPLAGIANTFLIDVGWVLRARLPFSYLQRARRSTRSLLEAFESRLRAAKSTHLALLMGLAGAELMKSKVEKAAGTMLAKLAETHPEIEDAIPQLVQESGAYAPDPEELRKQWKALLASNSQDQELIQVGLESARMLLSTLDEVIRVGASRQQLEELRQRVSELAKS